MDFFDRYTALCKEKGLQPSSQKTADMIGVTRATISTWGKSRNTPKGETLVAIADGLGVTVDYLLGRTDDPTDRTGAPSVVQLTAPTPAAPTDPAPPAPPTPRILTLFNQLDTMDQVRVEAYVEGMLASEKYRVQQSKKMG